MRINLFFIFILTVISSLGSFQQINAQKIKLQMVDSLTLKLKTCNDDSNKVKLLLQLSSAYEAKDTLSKYPLINDALSLTEKINWTRGKVLIYRHLASMYRSTDDVSNAIIAYQNCATHAWQIKDSFNLAESYSFIGTMFQSSSQFDSSLYYHQLSLKYRTNPRSQIASLANLAVVYNILGDFPRALDNYIQATKINQSILTGIDKNNDDSLTQAGLLFNTGEIYTEMKQYDKASENYQQVLEMGQRLTDTTFQMVAFRGIASTFSNVRNHAKCIEFNLKALALCKASNDLVNQPGILNELAKEYITIGEINQALDYLSDAKQIAEEKDYANNLPKIYTTLGTIYTLKKEYQSAITFLQKSIQISKGLGVISDQRDALQILSKVYQETNQPKEALETYQQFITLRDSIINVDKVRQMISTDMQFKFETKQLADSLRQSLAFNLKIQRQRVYTISSIIGLLVVLSFAFFIFRSYKRAQKANHIIRKANDTIHAEKQVSENLLLNILPRYVADELKHHGKVQAKLFENVTVLFTDFVNFTQMAERLSPDDLIAELDTCFKAFDEIAGKYKIEKIKTVGDAYLAVSGLPVAEPDHASEVVNAALDMRDYMIQRRAQLKDSTFEIRIGVHTGKVIAGIVGVKKFAYDVWGDTVNTAARMEQTSESGKVNISKATYEGIKDKFKCEYRGEIDAKNKGKLYMYFVERD